MVITRVPEHQGFIGKIFEKNTISYVEADNIDAAIAGLTVPTLGSCLVILDEDVTTVGAELVT